LEALLRATCSPWATALWVSFQSDYSSVFARGAAERSWRFWSTYLFAFYREPLVRPNQIRPRESQKKPLFRLYRV
jgi:hypothetical protein